MTHKEREEAHNEFIKTVVTISDLLYTIKGDKVELVTKLIPKIAILTTIYGLALSDAANLRAKLVKLGQETEA